MDYEVKTLKSLPKLNEQKKTAKRPIGEYILRSLLVLVFTVVLSASGQVIYDEIRYSPFIVDGESMYPILNYDTKVVTKDGDVYQDPANGWTLSDFSDPNKVYTVDYCYMDTHEKTLKNLHRFDIVVTYYRTDYNVDWKLLPNASLKVKRVIGLPGETVKFDETGHLYIKGKGENEFTYVDQPFLSYENNKEKRPLVTEEWYNSAMKQTTNGFETITTLGDDEYYVVGDNRRTGCSLDSRHYVVGAVKQSFLVGKAVTIAMKADYIPGNEPRRLYNTYKMPWSLEIL